MDVDKIAFHEWGYETKDLHVGDMVYDDLTMKQVKVLRIQVDGNNFAIWTDSDWLGGGRHPWEVTLIR